MPEEFNWDVFCLAQSFIIIKMQTLPANMPPLPPSTHASETGRDARKVFLTAQQVSEIVSDRLEPRAGLAN